MMTFSAGRGALMLWIGALLTITVFATRSAAAAERELPPRPLAERYLPARTDLGFGPPCLPPLDDYWYEDFFSPRDAGEWLSTGVTAGLFAGSVLLFSSGNETAIAQAGDLGQLLVPAAAFAVPIAKQDWRGLAEFGLSFGTTMGLTLGMKALLEKRRPDSSDTGSYPSGHTAAAFSGASFLYSRYGPEYGIPAYTGALYTAFSRVYAHRHYLDDVIAGAGVAMISNWLWCIPFGTEQETRLGRTARPTWRLEFGFGSIWQLENDLQSPEDIGTEIDLAEVEGTDDTLWTARFTLHWYPDTRSEIFLRVDPYELRGADSIGEELRFGESTFPAGTDLFVRWLGAEYKACWRYELLPRSRRWSLKPGATLIFADYLVELEGADQRERVGSLRAIPAPHLHARYEITSHLFAELASDGLPGLDALGFDVEGTLRWRLAPTWDLGLMYRWSRRQIGGDIDNDPVTQGLYLLVGRSF